MSYCVNCGVRLEDSIRRCPLCSTPVINPNEIPDITARQPYPAEKGQVEPVKKRDIAILISIVLLSTAIVCGLLNFFTFSRHLWSLPVIGICGILWVFAVPFFIYTKLPIYLSLLFDGAAIGLYLYLLTWLTSDNSWFWQIGLPIVLLLSALVDIMAFLLKKFQVSILFTSLIVFTEVAVLCIGIEIFIDRFLHGQISLSWSAVVLTVCAIIDITLITLLSKKRLRNAVRKRLHF